MRRGWWMGLIVGIGLMGHGPAVGDPVIGKPLPQIRGGTLSGRQVTFPRDLRGRVSVLLLGFTRESQYPVEAWERAFQAAGEPVRSVPVYVLPMMGNGLARMAAPLIDGGMRRHTPKAAQDHVVTVYQDLAPIKRGLDVTQAHGVYVVLVGQDGTVVGLWTDDPTPGKVAAIQARLSSL